MQEEQLAVGSLVQIKPDAWDAHPDTYTASWTDFTTKRPRPTMLGEVRGKLAEIVGHTGYTGIYRIRILESDVQLDISSEYVNEI